MSKIKGISNYLIDVSQNVVDSKKNSYETKSGSKLFMPVDHKDHHLKPHYEGVIIAVTKENKRNLKIGDKIVFHYLINEQVAMDGVLYLEEFVEDNPKRNAVYAIRRGDKFEMQQRFVMVDRVDRKIHKEIPGFIFPESHKEDLVYARVSNAGPEADIPNGAKVAVFNQNFMPIELSDQKVNILDTEASIPFYWDKDNNVIVMKGWVMIKASIKNDGYRKQRNGLIAPTKKHEDKMFGEIIQVPKGYKGWLIKGDLAYFQRKEYYKVELNNEEYYFANYDRFDHVKWVFKNNKELSIQENLAQCLKEARENAIL